MHMYTYICKTIFITIYANYIYLYTLNYVRIELTLRGYSSSKT